MKVKLFSFAIVLICTSCVIASGVLSVHRSEGRIISPELQAKIEAFLDEHEIELPIFITEYFEDW